jgi:hypothetical protein
MTCQPKIKYGILGASLLIAVAGDMMWCIGEIIVAVKHGFIDRCQHRRARCRGEMRQSSVMAG